MDNMSLQEAKGLLANTENPPDDLVINNRPWKLEGAYMQRSEAMASAEFFAPEYRLFPYKHGFALYQRDMVLEADVAAKKELLFEIDWSKPDRRQYINNLMEDTGHMICAERCQVAKQLKADIQDESEASPHYRNVSEGFREAEMPTFASAFRSMSMDEARHKVIIETVVDVLLRHCECK